MWNRKLPCRAYSRGSSFMPFVKSITAGYVLFCVPKENQKGRRCPQGMKAPSGAFKLQTGLRSKCRVFSAARSPLLSRRGRRRVCGSLRLLRALRGTRILQAAVPTAPPCFGHWPRSSPLQTRGCSPLVTPKQLGSIQKIQVAPLEDFLCCADFESLTRRTVRASLCSICCATAAG